MEFDGKFLCWMRVGSGVVMLGRANAAIHHIHSPLEVGLTTVMMNVYVHDIDAHYAHAVAEGANVTMDLDDAFSVAASATGTDVAVSVRLERAGDAAAAGVGALDA